MNRRTLKPVLGGIVLIATIIVFSYYIHGHPQIIRQLTKIPLPVFGLLLVLYIGFLGTLAWIQRITLRLCDIRLGNRESFILIAYSSIINFFGPLQSGPAFRAAYLKRKHNVKLKNYALATLLYYGFYAVFSGLFIAAYFIGLPALLAVILLVLLAPLLLLKFRDLLPQRFRELRIQHIGALAAATLSQTCVMAGLFYVELNSLGHHVRLLPSLIYTGSANFALFVSVTPGAIGIRETFLVFTQRLHHVVNSQIVSASLIDRGVYIVFMGILALLVFGLHAQKYLQKK